MKIEVPKLTYKPAVPVTDHLQNNLNRVLKNWKAVFGVLIAVVLAVLVIVLVFTFVRIPADGDVVKSDHDSTSTPNDHPEVTNSTREISNSTDIHFSTPSATYYPSNTSSNATDDDSAENKTSSTYHPIKLDKSTESSSNSTYTPVVINSGTSTKPSSLKSENHRVESTSAASPNDTQKQGSVAPIITSEADTYSIEESTTTEEPVWIQEETTTTTTATTILYYDNKETSDQDGGIPRFLVVFRSGINFVNHEVKSIAHRVRDFVHNLFG